MKRLFAFLASLLLLVGCEELLPKEKPVITLDPDQSTSVTVDAEGGSFDVHFTSALPWSVEIVYSGGSGGWAGISKGSGEGGYAIEKVQVIVQKNESDVQRSAKLVIKSDTVTEEVSFTQSAATTDPGHGQDPEPAVFKLTEGSAEVGADGGKVQVTVQYNVDYEITIPVDWIREVETKSYDEKVHTFEIDANVMAESRSATLSFCGNGTCIPFVITQEAAEQKEPDPDPVFNLSDGSAEVDAEGGRIQVTVQYNVDYEIMIPVDWIREVETKSYDEKVHTFEIDANTETGSRSATISFCGNGTCLPFNVSQAAAEEEPEPEPDPVFGLSKSEAEVGAEGGTVDVTVTANIEYEYTINVDWITEVTTRNTTDRTHVFEVAPNTESESRTATISFCGNETCHPFVITQAAAETDVYLDVDNVNISVAAEGTASPVTVNVTSNLPWNVASDAAWCEVSPSSGENDGSFDITVSENVSYDSRMANITVSAVDGSLSRTIAVIQSPAQKEEGDDSWVEAEFVHRSLAFRFTADWCGFCPMMATAMSDAQKELPGKLEVISVHGGGSGLACSASNTLANNYPIDGFPTGLVDGRTYIANYAIPVTTSLIVEAVNETESKYETVTAASWTSKVSGSQVTMDLSAYIKKAGSYKITALLVEDKVISYQADYNNGASDAYEHNGIIRAALSNVLGEDVEVTEDAQVKTFTYSAELPSECNKDNVRVVVYIQRKDSDNSYYVDNTASATVGKDKNLDISSGSWSDGNEGIVPGDDISIK
ncbi:MAG: Omp28-related outer membrane protein [Bacteroidales bacterium]|nr:Omp28-related outer membrane protein [Bacteroidales bacterium]